MSKIFSFNPNTGALLAEYRASSQSEINSMVESGRKSQEAWSKTPWDQRKILFERLAGTLQKKTEIILKKIEEESGKLRPDGEAELFDVIDAISYYITEYENKILNVHGSIKLNQDGFPNTNCYYKYVPYGVVGLIMPWNFPFYSPFMFILVSLVAGNAVILKPSEHTTGIGLMMKELINEAGFHENLFNVAIGADQTGRALVMSSVDKIFFVGSREAGLDIIKNSKYKPVQIELGGNSAALVLKDCDINQAANAIAWGGTYHAGQDCVGVKRVYVHTSIKEKFIKKLIEIVSGLRPGIDYPAYITKEAKYNVLAKIEEAVDLGAKLIWGAKEPKGLIHGNWLEPTLLEIEMGKEMNLVVNETFGNVLPIMTFDKIEDAITEINKSPYGLSNSIYTKNLEEAELLVDKLESGMVFINEPFIATPGWDHWTGWKESGYGTASEKIMQVVKKKVWSSMSEISKRKFWYPY